MCEPKQWNEKGAIMNSGRHQQLRVGTEEEDYLQERLRRNNQRSSRTGREFRKNL